MPNGSDDSGQPDEQRRRWGPPPGQSPPQGWHPPPGWQGSPPPGWQPPYYGQPYGYQQPYGPPGGGGGPPPPSQGALRRARSFSFYGLVVTVAGSIVGTAIPAFFEAGPGGTLAGTATLSVLTALGLTGFDKTAHGAKALITLILAGVAVVITVSGVTLTDLVRGESLFGDRQMTFPVTSDAGQPPTGTVSTTDPTAPTESVPQPTDPGETGQVIPPS